MVTDPIADFLIRVKNAARARRGVTSVPHSKMKEAMAEILVREGYLASVEKKGKKIGRRTLELGLHPVENGKTKVTEVARISKPGRRVYSSAGELPHARRGIIVVSTPAGLLTVREARARKLGGEVLFSIW